MLPRMIKTQLVLLTAVAVAAVVVLGWYYLRIPSLAGIGRYTLYAELPQSGGLYRTANVTYRGITIGKVTGVEPTERGARATMSIEDGYRIPADAAAHVHSVSAVGEQYVDLVSTAGREPYLADGQTIHKSTVPARSVPRWTPPTADWRCCPGTRSPRCSTKPRRRSVAWGRRCGAWWMPPRRSPTISGAASTTSTTSSSARHRSSTARPIPLTRLGVGPPT